jgi:hypothetical protein
MFLLDVERRMKVRLHLQKRGYDVRLVDPAGSLSSDVQFLQSDYICAGLRDHIGNPMRIELAVCADAAVHIVRQY